MRRTEGDSVALRRKTNMSVSYCGSSELRWVVQDNAGTGQLVGGEGLETVPFSSGREGQSEMNEQSHDSAAGLLR